MRAHRLPALRRLTQAQPSCLSSSCFSPFLPSSIIPSPRWESQLARPSNPAPFAFAFDVDGVLLRSSAPLPGATKTLRYLRSQQVPFILLTNGGGRHEDERVADLTKTLDVPLDTSNFIQSHTPFQELVIAQPNGKEGLRDKNVLVVGGEGARCRQVAERYGFKHAITPGDIFVAHPSIWPFSSQFISYYKTFARPIPKPIVTSHSTPHSSLSPSTHLQISSILVFNDPRDWALDSSIILDLLLSHSGYLGTRSKLLNNPTLPNRGFQQDSQPTLWFSNPDLFWASSYHHPRLGQGGFRESFEGLWSAVVSSFEAPAPGTTSSSSIPLQHYQIGKPSFETYSFADKILNSYRATLLGEPSPDSPTFAPLERVYMLGDNPASDIRGANEYASPNGTTEWVSVLLKSGVYDEDEGPPAFEPRVVRDGVLDGVKWALEREGWDTGEL